MINRTRIKASDVKESRFYQLPKWLIHEEEFRGLSNDAKVLYSIMRDRHELSLANNWVDADGYVYLIYTRQNMIDDLQISDKPVTNAVKQLKKYGLIDEVRQGCNKPNLIYVMTVSFDSQWTRKNSVSENVNIPYPNTEIFRPNDTNNNDTDISDTKKNKKQQQQENCGGGDLSSHTQPVDNSIQEQAPSIRDEIISVYKRCYDKVPYSKTVDNLMFWIKKIDYDSVCYALEYSSSIGKELNYAIGMLKKWASMDLSTFDDIFIYLNK